jgi:hypothetical protein
VLLVQPVLVGLPQNNPLNGNFAVNCSKQTLFDSSAPGHLVLRVQPVLVGLPKTTHKMTNLRCNYSNRTLFDSSTPGHLVLRVPPVLGGQRVDLVLLHAPPKKHVKKVVNKGDGFITHC